MAKKPSPFDLSLIAADIPTLIDEFRNGKPIGDTARIPVIKENFSWKRGFMNCWTGWPNDGKSTFVLFMMLMKSICDGWKWCIWSPEMYNSYLDAKKQLIISAGDLIDELAFMKTGQTPYLHFKPQFGITQMPEKMYIEAINWINEHFVFINPKDRRYRSLIDNCKHWHDSYEFDGFLFDPWKNIDDSEEQGRTDTYLNGAFSDIKQFSLETNSSTNIVAHPRSDKDPKNADGSYKLCTQFTLSGGSAWNNGMDGIYSIRRPWKHKNPQDPRVEFWTLKQRKQALVGKVGVYTKIEFNFETNRYYFDGHCPIDGSYHEPLDSKEKRERAAAEAAKKTVDDVMKPKDKKKARPPMDFSKAEDIAFEEKTIEFEKEEPAVVDDDKPIF